MMKTIAFVIVFFINFNLLAATYLICESNKKLLNVKLENKKIHIQYESEDFENYTPHLIKWNEELIKTERKIKYIVNKYNDCLWQNASVSEMASGKFSSESKKLCEEAGDIDIDKERLEIIIINRLSGELNLDTGRTQYNIWTNKWIERETIFNCKVQEKTLF